jgi:hypothetical protein
MLVGHEKQLSVPFLDCFAAAGLVVVEKQQHHPPICQ